VGEIFTVLNNGFTVLTTKKESYLTNVAGIHINSHFRPILDKTEVCRQRAVKILNVRQQFQENRRNSTVPYGQTGRQTDMTK
jgi:hypothetical protein